MRPGYKQTEVGMIPEDWDLYNLVDLIDESRGIRYGIVQPGKFDPSGRFMVRGQDYSRGWVEPSELFRVSKEVEEPFKNARVKAGDVVITIVGASTGHLEVIPDWLDGANLTQTTARLAISPTRASGGFCKFFLQSSAGQRQVTNYLKGAAQPGLNCGDIEKFQIPLPPTLCEQRAIAEALSDMDGLLSGLDRLLAKKRDLKQAAMQQLLTAQTRLPGFRGEWVTTSLGEISEIRDGTHQTPKYVPAGIPFYSVEHVTSGDFTNTKFISEAEHRFLTRSFRIEKGDILMTRIGSVGDCKIVDWDVDASFYVSLALLKVHPDFSAGFVAQYSNTNAFKQEVEINSLASAIPKKINLGPISNIKILLPPTKAEQTAIAEVLSEMDAELTALEARRTKTQALKQAMMHQLLTGQTRLV
ncbi:restriction endonuclease subunit S [Actomonas aquatica]|uniref:Restriction endonuclease subunit S n=1 Tax=Actomonas aquatica TaxID=2866162 RepID=A0ABZ1C253_9BACT|nr:restriction endonuclease subunit S [Opitutus sp. WL0086]WRQ85564.1 restriction endonuclease subunit S [Opitutus sp. WL0086]